MNKQSFGFGKKSIAALAIPFLLLVVPAANTAEKQVTPESFHADAPGLDAGVVTGHLVTVAGNNFFQYFIALWRDKPLSERYSLTVHERPDALRGSLIRIDCLNRTIFSAILPNSRSDIKDFSARAVEITYQNATQAEVQKMLFRDLDLGADEF